MPTIKINKSNPFGNFFLTLEDVIGFVKSFKTFTSKKLRANIIKTEPSVEKLFINEENNFSCNLKVDALWE